MTYVRAESKVIYKFKNEKKTKTFDALEWLVAMFSHVPNRGELNAIAGITAMFPEASVKKKIQMMPYRILLKAASYLRHNANPGRG